MIRLLLSGYKTKDIVELHIALNYALLQVVKLHEDKSGPEAASLVGQDLRMALDYITDVLQKPDNM